VRHAKRARVAMVKHLYRTICVSRYYLQFLRVHIVGMVIATRVPFIRDRDTHNLRHAIFAHGRCRIFLRSLVWDFPTGVDSDSR